MRILKQQLYLDCHTCRTLSMFEMLPTSAAERAVLFKHFAAEPDFRRSSESSTNYSRFLAAVDTEMTRTPFSRVGARDKPRRPPRPIAPATGRAATLLQAVVHRPNDRGVPELMGALELLVARGKLRVSEAFRDYDTQRAGRITRERYYYYYSMSQGRCNHNVSVALDGYNVFSVVRLVSYWW
jgi:hypothetical protein